MKRDKLVQKLMEINKMIQEKLDGFIENEYKEQLDKEI